MFTHCQIILSLFLNLLAVSSVQAWSSSSSSSHLSRRQAMEAASAAVASLASLGIAPASAVAASQSSLIADLEASKTKLEQIPDLLEAQKWDEVRSILKTPPVAFLWNLGDSKNTLLQLAKETGDVELFELKEDLAYNLQMCDQLTYDNVFVYFQPGAGKINIKEPKESAKKALQQLEGVIADSK